MLKNSPRRNFLPLALLLVCLLLVAGVGTYLITTSRATPEVSANFYGMNWHPIWLNDASQDAELDAMQQAGIKSVRLDLPWYFLEPSKGVYQATYFERLDHAVNGMVARGIDPLLIVTSAPTWATGAPSTDPSPSLEPPLRTIVDPSCDPAKTNCTPYNSVPDYDSFLTYVINRWAGKVHEYEIWNEPVGYWAWTRTQTDWKLAAQDVGADYATLLASAYHTAKSIDPSLTILGGSLSGTDGPNQVFVTSMLTTLAANQAANSFDVFSQHYYCDPPSDNWCNTNRSLYDPATLAATYTKAIVPILTQFGDGTKPVWVTETGYNTYTAGGGVTEAQQATYLTDTYTVAKTLPNVSRLYWYELDGTDTGTTTQNYYGIVEATYGSSVLSITRLKPAYAALQQLTASSSSPGVTGDLNNDGHVNVFDLSIFLNHWQQTGSGLPEDLNNDGVINIFDLSLLLGHWG
jgi:hypothetical protein